MRATRPPLLSCCLLGLALLFLLPPEVAEAKQTVAALAFGGRGAMRIRASILAPLRAKYSIHSGDELLNACDELGISMTRGRNLAKAAQHIGAVAIIGGAVTGGGLSLAVYSGRTGQPLITGRVAVRRGRLSPKNLRKALTIILKGLRKAPKRVGRRRAPPPAPAPAAEPAAAPAAEPASGGGGSDLTFEPDPVESSDRNQVDDSSEENPLGAPEENPLASKGPAPTPQPEATQQQVEKKPGDHGSPRAAAYVGVGIWSRDLSMNHPEEKLSNSKLSYKSGAAFALAVGFKVRPIAFLSDGFAGNFYSRLRFQTMLGLQSASEDGTFPTTLWELNWEVAGIDWNILGKPTGPHLEAGIGFGLMSFSIEWPEGGERKMPDAAYKWFLVSAGGYYPFMKYLGGNLQFDYRVVTGTGEIEDEKDWFGPSSTGGISLQVGLHGNYKGIVAQVGYRYTRYFYDFTDAEQRLKDITTECAAGPSSCTKKAAGGALDQQHGLIVTLGYSL